MSDVGLRRFVKYILFTSSYTPLYVVLAILQYTNESFVISMALFIILNLIVLGLIFYLSKRIGYYPDSITGTDNANEMSLEYLIAYIFPLLFVNYDDVSVALALVVIFMTMGYVYVRSDLIYLNPTLNIFGYNLYKSQMSGRKIIIISQREIHEISKYKLVQIADIVYLGR